MDPLSVGASVIAVVGATGKVIKGIRRLKALRDAPRELDDLLAEVSQFELVLQAIQKAYDTPGSEIGRLLETAQRILVEFESLIEYKLTEAGTSSKVDRWEWTRNLKDVERLRGQLRDVTINLVALVNVSTSTTLDKVCQVTNQMLSEHRQFSDQILPTVALLIRLFEDPSSARSALSGSLSNARQLACNSASQPDNKTMKISESKTLQADLSSSKLNPQNRYRMGKIQTVSICDTDCNCKCHLRRQVRAPGILSKFLGHGYIQIAGYSILGTGCDSDFCKAHAAPRISVQYALPQWLLSRMIFVWFTSSPSCSPELLLRVPRVVDSRSNKAFLAMKRLDGVEDLQVAIRNGDCTPYDVDKDGNTIFTIAARSTMWRILFCLSSHGDFCNPSSVAPWAESTLWRSLVLAPVNPFGSYFDRQITLLTTLFPLIEWESYVERQAFTTLHQIVCGLSGLSLKVELQGSTAINKLDRDGRSALWYAVTHRTVKYVRILLEHEADPNIGDPPIWALVKGNQHYAITELLLDYGASLSYTLSPSNGWLPWPDEELYLDKNALKTDELLATRGIDLNHRAKWHGVENVTILMRMAQYDARHRMKQLIEFGADIEIKDEEGKTAIMHAVRGSSHAGFDILARAGALIDLKTVTGSTVLHLAVTQTTSTAPMDEYSSVCKLPSLCEVMRNADLTNIDLDAKDEDGYRAFDLLQIRNGPNWDGYCQSKGIETYWWLSYYEEDRKEWEKEGRFSHERDLKNEMEAICALEKLLRHIQEAQGVPEADQYLPLGEYRSRDAEDEAVPGAWPTY